MTRSTPVKTTVLKLYSDGDKENRLSESQIAQKTSEFCNESVSKSTVHTIVRNALSNQSVNGGSLVSPQNLARKPGSGRPRLLTPRMIRRLILQATKSKRQRQKSWVKIANEVDLSWVSKGTIATAFRQAGYNRYVPVKQPHLTAIMRKARRKFVAKQLDGVATKAHHRILYSDETSLKLGQTGRNHITRQKGERWVDDCVDPKFKTASSFMFWGVVGYDYKGPGVFFRTKSSKQVKEDNIVIEEHQEFRVAQAQEEHTKLVEDWHPPVVLPPRFKAPSLVRSAKYKGGVDWYEYADVIIYPHIRKAYREFSALHPDDNDVLFMQDSAPAHRHAETIRTLAEFGISVLDWPGNSPDLNPIESIWELLKRQIRSKYGLITKRANMERYWNIEWDLLTIETINSVIDDYEQKLTKVRNLHGGNNYQG